MYIVYRKTKKVTHFLLFYRLFYASFIPGPKPSKRNSNRKSQTPPEVAAVDALEVIDVDVDVDDLMKIGGKFKVKK